MDYQESLDWLYSTQDFGVKLGLDNSKELLRKFLAYPSYNVKVIHVAGTNGKGSVCAMIEMLIRGSGFRAGLFTSPHLVHFRERMKVNSIMISEQECAGYLTKLRELSERMEHHPTFFELTMAMAMRFFKDQGAEYIVLETGMGGRLDATTAVPADLCVITPIAMDHSEWLGDSIEQIALEKAGIMLEGVPVIISKQDSEAETVLLEEANMKRSTVSVVDEPLVGYSIGIPGQHQRYNANVAVSAVHEIGIHLNYDTVKQCLEHVYWPGRFEEVRGGEYPIVIDGAHNPQAAAALVETWQVEYPNSKPIILFGAVECKDIAGVFDHLKRLSGHFILTPIDSPRTMSVEQLKEGLSEVEHIETCNNVGEALAYANEQNRPLLIAGSLFLVGEVKARLENDDFERSAQ